MNCRLIDQHLPEYCSGTLSDSLNAEIAAHISTCSSCEALYRLILLENEVLRESFVPPLADDFTAKIMHLLRPKMAEPYRLPVWRRWGKYAAGLAAAAVLIALLPRLLPLASFDALVSAPERQPMVADSAVEEEMAPTTETSSALKSDATVMEEPAPNNISEDVHSLESGAMEPLLIASDSGGAVSPPYASAILYTAITGDTHDDGGARSYADSSEPSRAGRAAAERKTINFTPGNIPAVYTLTSVESINAEEANFHYVNQFDQSELCISINQDNSPETVARLLTIGAEYVGGDAAEARASEPAPVPNEASVVLMTQAASEEEATADSGEDEANAEADVPEPAAGNEDAKKQALAVSPVTVNALSGDEFNMIQIDYYGSGGVYQVSFHSNGSLNEILELASDFRLDITDVTASTEN